MFPYMGWNTCTSHVTVNSLWDFDDHQPNNAYFTQNVMVNLGKGVGIQTSREN